MFDSDDLWGTTRPEATNPWDMGDDDVDPWLPTAPGHIASSDLPPEYEIDSHLPPRPQLPSGGTVMNKGGGL